MFRVGNTRDFLFGQQNEALGCIDPMRTTSDAVSWKFSVQPKSGLFTFQAHFSSLSAAQNAPPAGCPPAGGAFYIADKQKNPLSKVNRYRQI